MTALSLERLHLRPSGTPLTARLRHGLTAWSTLIERSVQTGRAYQNAGSASARQKVLDQFVNTGA
jgi:hypothetical protein